MTIDKQIAFIGGGMMGSAMISGILNQALVGASQIIVSDPDTARGEKLVADFGIDYTVNNLDAVQGADVVVLAVKPQFFDTVASELVGRVSDADFVLSIMAGVPISTISEKLEVMRIVRSIPNTPGSIGQGITAWLATESVKDEDVVTAQLILESLGETLQVPKEVYMDMATAVSGSGPAYVFLFMEAMIDAAVHMGFSRADAEKLVNYTVSGSARYAVESGTNITVLRNQVTSPGGTTAEALYHMEKLGLRNAVARGIWGAMQRSIALGGGDPRDPDTSI